MGQAYSHNVASIAIDAISQIGTDVLNETIGSGYQDQILEIKDVDKDVIISGNTFNQVLSVDMKAFMDAMVSQTSLTDLSTQITQETKSVTQDLNLFNYSVAINESQQFAKAVTEISSNLVQSCAALTSQRQEIYVKNVNGSVIVSNNTSKQLGNMFSSCVQEALLNNSAVTNFQSTLDQSATALTKGLNIMDFVFAAIAGVVLVVVMGTFIESMKRSKNGKVIYKNASNIKVMDKTTRRIIIGMGIASLVLGLLSIPFFVAQTNEKYKLRYHPFSKGIDPLCGREISSKTLDVDLKQDSVDDVLGDVVNKCLQDNKCAGFDLMLVRVEDNGKLTALQKDERKLEVFSKVATIPCSSMSTRIDNTNLLQEPTFIGIFTATPDQTTHPSNFGDVYMSAPSGQLYFRRSDGWRAQADLFVCGENVTCNTTNVQYDKDGPGGAPYGRSANEGDFYIQKGFTTKITIWQYSSGDWNIEKELKGPGMGVADFSVTNSTAIKFRREWMKAVGISLAAIGGAGVVAAIIILFVADRIVKTG